MYQIISNCFPNRTTANLKHIIGAKRDKKLRYQPYTSFLPTMKRRHNQDKNNLDHFNTIVENSKDDGRKAYGLLLVKSWFHNSLNAANRKMNLAEQVRLRVFMNKKKAKNKSFKIKHKWLYAMLFVVFVILCSLKRDKKHKPEIKVNRQ